MNKELNQHSDLSSTGQVELDLTGDLVADKRRLADYCQQAYQQLMPFNGTDEQIASLSQCRRIRQKFLTLHLDYLIDNLEQLVARGHHLSVSDVARHFADLVPELLPSEQQLNQDAQYEQQHKLGCEFDIGVFYNSLFADAKAGQLLLDLFRRPTAKALDLKAQFERDGKLEMKAVILHKQGNAGHITFNNPDCLNAEDNQLISDFETAVDLILLCDEIKVGVLRGGKVTHPRYKGKRVFSAGINLKHISKGDISFCDFILAREVGYIHKMLRGINLAHKAEHEKAFVGAVDTFAIGGGMQLLLVCDQVIACEDAYASLPAAKEGIVPGVANLRLGRAATGRLAQQVILQGKRLFATDPQSCVVFDLVVSPEQMDEAIAKSAAQMSAAAVVTNRKMLRISQEPQYLFQQYMSQFSLEQVKRLYSEDVLAKVGQF